MRPSVPKSGSVHRSFGPEIGRRRLLGALGGGLAGLAGLSSVSTRAAGRQLLVGGLEIQPWFTNLPGWPGIGAEIMDWIGERAGLSLQPRLAPADRLRQEFASGFTQAVIFLREPRLDAAGRRLGSVGDIQMMLFCRAGLSLESLEQVRSLRIGTNRGDVALSALQGHQPADVEQLKDIERGVVMLDAGRLDGLLSTDAAFHWQARRLKLSRERFGTPFPLARLPVEFYANATLDPSAESALLPALEQSPPQWDNIVRRYRDESWNNS
jgi:hypothetical protein